MFTETPGGFAPRVLTDLLATVDPLWSEPSRFADTGAHDGYQQVSLLVAGGRLAVPEFAELLAHFTPVRAAWLSRLAPGGYIVEHCDAGPYFERWQVPFTTCGQLIEDGEPVAHRVGVPFRVHQWRWHSVRNDGPDHRVSLVIDRDIPVDVPSAGFTTRHMEPPCPSFEKPCITPVAPSWQA